MWGCRHWWPPQALEQPCSAAAVADGAALGRGAHCGTEATRRYRRQRDPRRLTGEIEEDTGDSAKDKVAQALGKKGGAARRDKLTPERRTEIAREAARRRWGA
jgi:hypothetical protein